MSPVSQHNTGLQFPNGCGLSFDFVGVYLRVADYFFNDALISSLVQSEKFENYAFPFNLINNVWNYLVMNFITVQIKYYIYFF